MKPMLAAKVADEQLEKLVYPMLVSPKLDGIRCLITPRGAMSRNLKLIRNVELQSCLKKLPVGLDGELIVKGGTFSDVSSIVMSYDADCAGIEYHVFDFWLGAKPLQRRVHELTRLVREFHWVHKVEQTAVSNARDIRTMEELYVSQGYEGIIIRDPESPYKFGRSTVREQGLLKLKRFCDSEAEIVGFVEMMHNANEATKDELGRTKRSSAKAGKKPLKKLGAIKVRDIKTGVEFEVGCGWSDKQRKEWWKARTYLIGKIVKYRFQPAGVKDKPRFPTFVGLRHKDDM